MNSQASSVTDSSTGKKTLWLVVGQSILRSGQIGIALFLVKFLAPSEWNSVALSLTVYLAAVTVGSFNLEHSVLFFLPSLQQHEADALFARTAVSLSAVGGGIGLVIVAVTRWGGFLSSSGIGALVALAVALEIPTVIAGPALIAKGRERAAGMWDAAHGTIQLVLVVGAAMLSLGEHGVITGLVIASIVRCASFLALFSSDILGHWRKADGQLFRRQLLFCAPLGVALATGVLTRTIDKWLVAWKLPARVGVYAIAAQEVPILAVLPYASGAAIAVVMVKHFANGDHESSFAAWTEQVKRMCRPVAALTILMVVISPQVFKLSLAPTYQESVLPFQIFTLIGLHRVTEYGAVLRAVGRTREIVVSSILLFVFNVVFAGMGLALHGLVGLTMGSVFAFACAWIWMLNRLTTVFHMPLSRVFPWKVWALNIGSFTLVAIVAELAASATTNSITQLFVKCLVFGGAYLVLSTYNSDRSNDTLEMLGVVNV